MIHFSHLPSNQRRRSDPFRDRRLDVRVHADAGTDTRRLWFLRVAGIAVLLLAGAILARPLRSVLLDGWMYKMPALALKSFPIFTDGVLSREEIEQTADVRFGQNVLALDLPLLQERLTRHPRIQSATVERILPDTLQIDVRERIPVARVVVLAISGLRVSYLIDDQAVVMLPIEKGRGNAEAIDAEGALPLITGADVANLVLGRVTAQSDLRATLRLLSAFDRSDLAGITEISGIDLSVRGVLRATTSQSSLITFRPDNIDGQLADWQRIWNEGTAAGCAIATLDLAAGLNIPLRWHENLPPPSPEKKTLKPKRNRSNHV
ncbi:MAG: FtsQ-type POTRA domain-containing protein [Pedosphaera sp.]|nr:FtsQ-type POTRA domain-containing protein [Pedosphaera sp.]